MTTLDGLLAATAAAHPSRPALAADGRTWTYAELNTAVDDLARRLEQAGVAPGDRVGVFAAKSAAAVLAIYAGLRAGAIVAPLDVRSPVARTRRMAEQAGFSLLLTTSATRTAARSVACADPDHTPAEGDLGHDLGWTRCVPAPPPRRFTEGGYVLFTSGSTGWPKGVLLSHENVAHFASWAAGEVGLVPGDRIGSQAALTFDLSTFDLFSTAAAGACVVLMPERIKAFPRDVVGWLSDEAISVLYAVPSLYHEMLERGGLRDGLPPALRAVLYAGEPFPPHALEMYVKLVDGRPVYNLYGPTETNVCTFTRVPPDWTAGRELTVGRPIPGDLVDVFDESGRTDGDGEICVAGATVFQGYLEGGELRDPCRPLRFADGTVRRAYPTGDLGRRTPDGQILLRGRRDVQVKRRGYRIDLGEIESVAGELAGVATVAAVQKKAGPHDGEIWLYASGSAADAEILRHLGGHLPAYMVPDRVVLLDALPVNDRGKTNRLALASAETKGVHGDPS